MPEQHLNSTRKSKAVLDFTLSSPQGMKALPERVKMLSAEQHSRHPTSIISERQSRFGEQNHPSPVMAAFIAAFGYCKNFYNRPQIKNRMLSTPWDQKREMHKNSSIAAV